MHIKELGIAVVLFIIVLLQALLLDLVPSFAKVFDLVLLSIVATGIIRTKIETFTFAMFAGLFFDLQSIALPFLNTFIFLMVTTVLTAIIPKRFYRFNTFVFLSFCLALIFKILISFILMSLWIMPLSLPLLFKIDYFGFFIYLLVSFALSGLITHHLEVSGLARESS